MKGTTRCGDMSLFMVIIMVWNINMNYFHMGAVIYIQKREKKTVKETKVN